MSDDISATAEPAAQEVIDSVQAALYPEADTELDNELGEEASEDVEGLPEDDDLDLDDEDGSEDIGVEEDSDDASLSELLGIDDDRLSTDEDGAVVFSAKIDGETKQVKLKDLVASYQLQGHVNNNSMALAAEKKEFEEQRALVTDRLQQQLTSAAQQSQLMETQLTQEYNSIDWDRLRSEDPAEWSALKQEYAQRANQLQQVQNNIAVESKKVSDEKSVESNAIKQEYVEAEFKKMLANNPSWSDDATRVKETTEMRSFLSSQYGFGDDDMSDVNDSRLISLIQDAKAYREGKSTAQAKKVKKVPKYQKPGASRAQTAALQKARGVKALKAKAQKSGMSRDIAALIENRM